MSNTSPAVQLPWHMVPGSNTTAQTRHEAQRFARSIVESQDYRDSITRRMKNDELPAAVETMLWYYAYGKPLESLQVSVSQHEELASLSVAELQERAAKLQEKLEEALQLERTLDTVVVQGPWQP